MCFLIAFLFIKSRLTAFVMRVFCEAQQFDGVNIDEEMVCQSVDWLVGNQRVDGALPEVQMVYHREMVVSSTLIGLLFGGRGAVWAGGAGGGGWGHATHVMQPIWESAFWWQETLNCTGYNHLLRDFTKRVLRSSLHRKVRILLRTKQYKRTT